MAGRTLVAPCQFEFTNGPLGLSINVKLQTHALRIVAAAAETVIEPMFLVFGAVSVEWFVFSHEFNRILALKDSESLPQIFADDRGLKAWGRLEFSDYPISGLSENQW
jgi:hypothetical protein